MDLTARLAVCTLLGALVPLTCRAASDEQKDFAFSVVERNAAPMAKIGNSIYYFAELGMQEFESTKLMKDVLEAGGFTVQLGAAGMPTNLWARYGNGHPAIAIVSEIDALPEGSQDAALPEAPLRRRHVGAAGPAGSDQDELPPRGLRTSTPRQRDRVGQRLNSPPGRGRFPAISRPQSAP